MDYMEDKMKAVNYNPRLRLHLFIVLVVSALISIFFGGYFTRFFIAEIAILSIFAMSLDFLAARGGLVSLGHAMFLGIGAYSTTIFSLNLGISPFIATILSLLILSLIHISRCRRRG